MSHVCDFPTEVRLLAVGSLAVLVDLHDPDNGFDIAANIRKPLPLAQRQTIIKPARAGGSYAVGARVPDDGVLTIPLLLMGDSWGACEQHLLDVVDVLEANEDFYVETVLSGVTTRWYCNAPVEFNEVESDRKNNRQRYDLSFTVQPHPSVTIA